MPKIVPEIKTRVTPEIKTKTKIIPKVVPKIVPDITPNIVPEITKFGFTAITPPLFKGGGGYRSRGFVKKSKPVRTYLPDVSSIFFGRKKPIKKIKMFRLTGFEPRPIPIIKGG
jgi:hypothetical protein